MKTTPRRISLGIGCLAFLVLLLAPTATWAQSPSWLFGAGNLDLLLMSTDTVQNELKITAGQGELLEALGEDLRAQPGFGQGQGRRRRRSRADSVPTSQRIIRVLLEEEQRERLSELRFQFQGPYAIDHEEFANKVTLTAEQLEAIREARKKQRVLRHSQLVELIGEEKANAWQKILGKRLRLGRELSSYRSAYLELMQEKAKSVARN